MGAAVTQLLCILIAAVIYTPCVLVTNHQKPAEEEE